MNKPSPITHNGRQCDECTSGTTIHANNMHRITPKTHAGYMPCPRDCQHPITVAASSR